ncbi:MAG: phosphatase [Eubacteriaceae bacterium]|nr:phosphatase [Eubacteriaceae bacterium]
MKTVLDTHMHTVACNHAYSTIAENAAAAREKGLELICITEHGPKLPGGPHYYFFANLKVVPSEINGVKILKGIETNILDYDGTLDIPEPYKNRMEIVLAGLHSKCYTPGSKKENTRAIIKTIENKLVDIMVHLGNPAYDLDYEDILKAAKDNDKLIEINNSSFVHSRPGSYPNCIKIAEKCMKDGIKVTLGSDAHIANEVGEFGEVVKMFDEMNFPEELVMNTSVEKLVSYLKGKNKVLFLNPRENLKKHRGDV